MIKTFNVHIFLTAYRPSEAPFYLKYAPTILLGLTATSSVAPPSDRSITYRRIFYT